MVSKRGPGEMNYGRTAVLKGEKLAAFNKARYGDRIREYRMKRGFSQLQLAKMIGVANSSVPNWEVGRTRPDTNLIPALCEALGVSISTFFGETGRPSDLTVDELRLVNNYRFLSELNKKSVKNLIDTMLDNEDTLLRERCENGFEQTRRSSLRASAGRGFDLSADEEAEYVYVRVSREACRCDEIITVSGDSMAPTYRDGDDLFVEYAPAIDPGEIGVFIAVGEGYVKEFRPDGLYSHNPEYPALRFQEDDNVHCVGRVLGVVGKEQYATETELAVIDELRREKAGLKG